ncbi:MAG: amidohydrolase family protein [Acidimicrobiia bacterium]|nr:amidohydrolase family protein [Acidimicrobiia bacterium]
MTAVSARWVLPVNGAPVAGGWVSVANGRVAEVGDGSAPAGARDFGDTVLVPGLINAHTHLELSWMAGRVPPQVSMDAWIRTMMGIRRVGPAGGDGEIAAAMRDALASATTTGTVLIGDISNSLASVSVLAEAGVAATIFHEILGLHPIDAKALVLDAHQRLRAVHECTGAPVHRCAVVAHAPYSTSPKLFREIAARHVGPAPLAVHLAESNEEMEFLRTGQGPIREMLEALGVWTGTWTPPGSHPVRYLRDLGYLQPGTLLVHGVHFTADDLDDARAAEAVVVTCPRSNVWVGGGVPPIARFYASGVDVAIGTDSLTSVDSLNLFDELAAMRRLAPEVDAARLLESATRVGAEALGYTRDYGTISTGKLAKFVAVQLPSGLMRGGDVEEYLVSGVPASSVSLVDLTAP